MIIGLYHLCRYITINTVRVEIRNCMFFVGINFRVKINSLQVVKNLFCDGMCKMALQPILQSYFTLDYKGI